MAKLLILEPDNLLRGRMCRALERAGYSCVAAGNAAEGRERIERGGPLTAVMNTRLPWAESCDLLRALEEKGLPVLFIASDPGNADHLRAMYPIGCEVLISPFDAEKLAGAVEELLRRVSSMLVCGALSMDTGTHRVLLRGREMNLTGQEFELLRVLMESPNAAVSREDLLRRAWGFQSMGITRTVDVHVQRLRRKLGADSIETVYRYGYRLKAA